MINLKRKSWRSHSTASAARSGCLLEQFPSPWWCPAQGLGNRGVELGPSSTGASVSRGGERWCCPQPRGVVPARGHTLGALSVPPSPNWGLGSSSTWLLRASSLPGAGRTGEVWDLPLGELRRFGTCQGASLLGFSEVCCEPVPSGWLGLASPPAPSGCAARLRLAKPGSPLQRALLERGWHVSPVVSAPDSLRSQLCVCLCLLSVVAVNLALQAGSWRCGAKRSPTGSAIQRCS